MKLFLQPGFCLRYEFPYNAASVLKLGSTAESNVLAFLQLNGSRASAYGTIATAMKRLQNEGKLGEHILAYKRLVERKLAIDDTPVGAYADFL